MPAAAAAFATDGDVVMGDLPSREDIVLQDAEMRQILLLLRQRSAGGADKPGRYNLHDTARLRFIRDKVLVGLRFGKLCPDDDLRMLRLPAKQMLRGADLTAMDRWSDLHGRDPRKKGGPGGMDEQEQLTLLAWVSRNSARFSEPEDARRGRAENFVIDFGLYQRCKLVDIAACASRDERMPGVSKDAVPPSAYLLWLASDGFNWQFNERSRANRAKESGYKRESGTARGKRLRENQGGGDGEDEVGDGVAVDPQTEGAGEVGLFQRVARGVGLGGGGRPT